MLPTPGCDTAEQHVSHSLPGANADQRLTNIMEQRRLQKRVVCLSLRAQAVEEVQAVALIAGAHAPKQVTLRSVQVFGELQQLARVDARAKGT